MKNWCFSNLIISNIVLKPCTDIEQSSREYVYFYLICIRIRMDFFLNPQPQTVNSEGEKRIKSCIFVCFGWISGTFVCHPCLCCSTLQALPLINLTWQKKKNDFDKLHKQKGEITSLSFAWKLRGMCRWILKSKLWESKTGEGAWVRERQRERGGGGRHNESIILEN